MSRSRYASARSQGSQARHPQPTTAQGGLPVHALVQYAMQTPSALSAQDVLHLQRSIGNQAVQRLLVQQSNPLCQATPSLAGKRVQRKTEQFPKAKTLVRNGMIEFFTTDFLDLKAYKEVCKEVEKYHEKIDPDDYGQQLLQLEEIQKKIPVWQHIGKLSPYYWYQKKLTALGNSLQTEEKAVKQQAHTIAYDKHLSERATLKRYLREGTNSKNDRRLKNSCEWLLSNQSPIKVYAVTATGDSTARLAKAGKTPAKDEAFFPRGDGGSPGDILSNPVSYDKDDLKDKTVHLYSNGKQVTGWNDSNAGVVTFTKVSERSRDEVWETIRHEVQHQADKNKGRDSLFGAWVATKEHDRLEKEENLEYDDYELLTKIWAAVAEYKGSKQIPGKDELKIIDSSDKEITVDQVKFNDNAYQQTVDDAFNKTQSSELLDELDDKMDKHKSYQIQYEKNIKETESKFEAEANLQRYKTEYRAYSYQGASAGYGKLDNKKPHTTYQGYSFTERQWAIFSQIYQGYEHTKEGWDNDLPLMNGKSFRQAVVDYVEPDSEGFNTNNSMRIDAFYNALDKLGKKAPPTKYEKSQKMDFAPVLAAETDPDSNEVDELLKAIDKLDNDDKKDILASKPYLDKLKKHLSGGAYKKVDDYLRR